MIFWTLGSIPEPHFFDAGISPRPLSGSLILTSTRMDDVSGYFWFFFTYAYVPAVHDTDNIGTRKSTFSNFVPPFLELPKKICFSVHRHF